MEHASDVNGMGTGAAMRKNAQLGYVNGSIAPFGFKATTVQVGSRAKRRLVPNEDERETVVELFRAYVGGRGAKAVAADLNVRGLRHRGGSLWRKNHVLRVISETACIGTYYWGQTDARTKKRRDKSEWIAIVVAPIIERELFDMTQQIRRDRDPAEVKGRTSSSPLLLAGVVCCEQRGSSLGLETSGKQTADGERPFRYYNCRRFLTSGKKACPGTRIPEAKLDQAILEHLADKVFTQERCRKILSDVVEETNSLRRLTDEQRAALQTQLTDIERRVARWQDAFETGAESADVPCPASANSRPSGTNWRPRGQRSSRCTVLRRICTRRRPWSASRHAAPGLPQRADRHDPELSPVPRRAHRCRARESEWHRH